MTPLGSTRARGSRAVVLAALLALAGALAPATAVTPVAAASDARVTGSATYTLAPAAGLVQVSVDMTLTDIKPDTDTRQYYLVGYSMGIQPEATAVQVTRGGTPLATTITHHATDQQLDVRFGLRVYHGKSTSWRITYDLPDSGPRATGRIRVNPAFAAFYAWAYGPDGASVRVVVPSGFTVSHLGSALSVQTTATGTVLSATGLATSARWGAWVTAEQPAAMTSDPMSIPLGSSTASLDVQAFPDDPLWRSTVQGELRTALPALSSLIGLPWPVAGTLAVSEAYAPILGGYAGLFDQGDGPGQQDRIRITEDPDRLVIAHEASHAWFNGSLFAARWINEGLAQEYAALAVAGPGGTPQGPPAVSPTEAAAFPLEAWPAPGTIDDQTTSDHERYGYAASWTLTAQLVAEIGLGGMRQVLAAAADHRIAYAGRPAPETAPAGQGPLDWRAYLDLLEQVGGSTLAERLFARWVVPQDQQGLLAAHRAATSEYAALLAQGRGWLPGLVVRAPMATWDFGTAETAMAAARAVLADRDRIQALAGQLGIAPSKTLDQRYEEAATSLAAAQALARDQLATLDAIAAAHGRVAADRDLVTSVGLIGSQPQAALDAAAAAFSHDQLATARQQAALAVADLQGATALGQQRLVLGAGLLLVLAVGALALLVRRGRRRRRARRAFVMATATLAAKPRPTGAGTAAAEGPSEERPGP